MLLLWTIVYAEKSAIDIGIHQINGRAGEDRYVSEKFKKDGENWNFLAIFDGHGGKGMAEYAEKNFFVEFEKHVSKLAIPDALKTVIEKIDCSFLKNKKNDYSGSTAIIACVSSDASSGYVANLGDSRAILFDENGKCVFYTKDHNPGDKSEASRIEKAGGFVKNTGGGHVWRVAGRLAMSRALGDRVYKGIKGKNWVSATPDIYDKKNGFTLKRRGFTLLLASDGLWEKFFYKNLGEKGECQKIEKELLYLSAKFAAECLNKMVYSPPSAQCKAECLARWAITDRLLAGRAGRTRERNQQTRDDVTAIVLQKTAR